MIIFFNKSNISRDLPQSIGDPLELLIVYEEQDFGHRFIKILKSFLHVNIGPSPQPESLLSLIEIDNNNFKGIFKRHQNLLIISKADTFSIKIKRDLFAADQFAIFVNCPSTKVLQDRQTDIARVAQIIKQIETGRLSTKFRAYSNTGIAEKIKAINGVSLTFPKDFFLAHTDSNIVWARRETEKISQGIFISNLQKPIAKKNLQLGILELIDSIIKPHISGPKDYSYMTIEKLAPVKQDSVKINNHIGLKVQSLWRMENDFMGGIFNAYYFEEESRQGPIIIYTYLYAPGEKKNILLIQLEAIIGTLQ